MSRPKAGAGATETPALKPYINPVRLSVKTRETPSHNDGPDVDIDNAEAGPSTSTLSHIGTRPLSEQERLLKARKANEQVRKKGEKWADKLMEETVDRATFKKAVSVLSPHNIALLSEYTFNGPMSINLRWRRCVVGSIAD